MPLDQAWQAGLWTMLAALSLPVGATVGLLSSPISQMTVAACMAFGAGALIFAIAIELYATSVNEMRSGAVARYALALQSVATIIGAVIYVSMDRFLLHRPTVGTSSLQKFGLRGPSAMSRNEWLDAEAERDDMNADLLPDADAAQRKRRPSINADDPEVMASNNPKSHAAKERNFAMVLWSASWLDTLPQAVLIGLLAGEGRLHLSFVLAAFLANFPQALASASLLMEFKASPMKVLLAWSSIWLVSSGVAFLVGWVTPVGLEDGDAGVVKQTIGNIVSGLTGGAMIAYTAATMLPAAFERSGRNATVSGLLCTIGFVAALTMEVFAGPMDEVDVGGSASTAI